MVFSLTLMERLFIFSNVGVHTVSTAKSLQSCLTLCNAIDSSQPRSAIPGILQARVLEWAAIVFSRNMH